MKMNRLMWKCKNWIVIHCRPKFSRMCTHILIIIKIDAKHRSEKNSFHASCHLTTISCRDMCTGGLLWLRRGWVPNENELCIWNIKYMCCHTLCCFSLALKRYCHHFIYILKQIKNRPEIVREKRHLNSEQALLWHLYIFFIIVIVIHILWFFPFTSPHAYLNFSYFFYVLYFASLFYLKNIFFFILDCDFCHCRIWIAKRNIKRRN